MITAEGTRESVTFDGGKVVITRTRGSRHGQGQVTLYVPQISAVRLKAPGAMFKGYIWFVVPGTIAAKTNRANQTHSAFEDPNAVGIPRRTLPDFIALRDAVDSAVAAHHATGPAAPSMSLADELGKLNALAEQGAISAEEFATAKTKLLGA